jgi:hypothetical protein
MHDRITLDWRDGWLCVAWRSNDFELPEWSTQWFPAYQCHRSEVADLIGRAAEPCGTHGGTYTVRTADYPAGRYMTVRLADGGRTHSIAFETGPIPPPKVRAGIETRYRNGQWCKLLKSRGWVTA